MFDPKRAREVADRIEAYGTIGPRGVERTEAAAMLRAAAEIVERLPSINGIPLEYGQTLYHIHLNPDDPQFRLVWRGEPNLATVERLVVEEVTGQENWEAYMGVDLRHCYSTREALASAIALAAAASGAKEQT